MESHKSNLHLPLLDVRDSECIRLLHLCPAQEEQDAIRCHISVASLKDELTYEALSYVWGDYTSARYVEIGDHSVAVTDNLYSALKQLRLPVQERLLWIDALCINQSDVNERNDQVSIMSLIYKRAYQVVVWLGDIWEGVDMAINYLRAIGNDDSLHLNPSLAPAATVDDRTLESSELCDNLVHFFDLLWWKRTWTVQEFALATRLVFRCGKYEITQEEMYMARENFWSHKDRCCPFSDINFSDPRASMRVARALEVPARLDLVIKNRTRTYSVLEAIARFCKRGVSDPRDRIYGMLGLGTGEYTNLIQPDYKLSPAEVCEAVVIQSLERTGKLEFLSHLFPHQNADLPSFVPNWAGDYEWNDIYALWLGHVPSFSASGSTRAAYERPMACALSLQGLIFDSIVATCPASLIDNLREADYLEKLCKLVELEESPQAQYGNTGDSKIQAFWHTLSGGMKLVLRDSNRYYERLKGSTDLSSFQTFAQFVTASRGERRELWNVQTEHILLDVEAATQGRVLFVTESGYFGLAPQRCEAGDLVTVLLGGDVPYVIRPAPPRQSTRCFTIQGDAYVHGIMDGEALEPLDNLEGRIEEIVLV